MNNFRLKLPVRKILRELDNTLLLTYLALMIIGFLAVLSSKGAIAEVGWFSIIAVIFKQLFFIGISLSGAVLSYIFFKRYLKHQSFLWLSSVLLVFSLILVLLIGREVNGAKSWILIGSMQLQPSEFVKVFLIWWFGVTFSATRQNQYALSSSLESLIQVKKDVWLERCLLYGPVALMVFLIKCQPDWGTNIVIFTLWFILQLVANRYRRGAKILIPLVFCLALFIICFVPLSFLKFLPRHMYSRFLAFREPFAHADAASFQMVRGFMAMSRGGWLGQGPGASLFKTGYLPEASTDFIMAILAEEWGFVGVIVILGLLLTLILRLYYLALKARTRTNKYILTGVASLFLIQSVINLGGLTAIIPLTGITLPFLSYGGSSLLAFSMAIGLAFASLDVESSYLRLGKNRPSKRYSRQRFNPSDHARESLAPSSEKESTP
ncbi:FtsW/RodA/SpoVE family cell cycle protein [Atopobacter sp. AH10]|uniref:FtsW/RodA/SpoVE family cell cycle protein n=1 Tax=Atopobacter sp. AH10 TaxID=2315861 RepID=UPI000EF217DD|nr:FtsW/RodA/SpoVE family cell cycle protein [Atopobacter sp. AH10]RLK64010.1 FtsW/RodA/SpoVE family cell cycle protein [Atopobacter sp. AH10]